MPEPKSETEQYDLLGNIGHGSFGVIRKVKRKSDGMILCRKEISYVRMSLKEREQLYAEFSILSSLKHSNIVGYYHRDHLKASQEVHMYMEYCGGGDLAHYIKKLKEENKYADEGFVWHIFAQLIAALYRCHCGEDPPAIGDNVFGSVKQEKQGLPSKVGGKVMILHRDLKPDNIFFGDRHTVKLGDFGLSKLMQSHDFASTYVGTPYYMSPEICAAESYTSHSDIWSVGCIIYELCTKRPPFDAKTHFHLISKIKEGRYEPLPAMYSPELQAMIKSCLNTNPLRRPRTADLMNMPVVRLARKQAEVVELGATLQIKIKETDEMKKQADAVVANKDREQETYRHFMDDKLRREWEVKARLEIDRQVGLEVERQVTNKVQAELERLQKTYQTEVSAAVAARVQEEVAKHSASLQSSFSVPELSSQMTNATNDTAPTDISSLSFESPIPVPTTKEAPIKKSSRTPFSRARTQVDSPMDVQMISPSPMSIASLSLSPRRATALAQGLPTNNIFGAARNKDGDRGRRDRWQPQQLETLSSDDEDETNFLPDLSPTRPPRAAVADPFKAPRPAFKRQSTMPVKPTLPSNIFSDNHSRGKEPTKPSGIPTSPTRATRPARPFTKAHTTAGGEEMLKAVTQKNMMEGRTLVELAQAKAATVGEGSGYKSGTDNEGSSWQDDDDEEIPSPFLVRTRRPVVGFGR